LFVLQCILIIGNVKVNPGPELENHSSVSNNSISICNINILSARNKLDFLNNFTHEFDIIAVAETYLHTNISNNDIDIDSFSKHIIRKDRNNAGGGLLNHYIGMGYQNKQSIILTGDLNSDLFTSHNNKLIDTINLLSLMNVIEKPSRVTEHNSTLLDPIIISDSIHYSFSDVLKVPSDISDHGASNCFYRWPYISNQIISKGGMVIRTK
jgi:hypothetical protein